jgi:small GTP-binding protein
MNSSSSELKIKDSVSVVAGRQQTESNTDYRVVVFGSAGVGKSSLVLRFVKGTYKDSYVPTIEDTYRQVITNNKLVCTLQIIDTTGSHQFPAMQRLNIQKGHAFILVYSINSKQSLEELRAIYKDIVEIKGFNEIKTVPIMLVGNKSDENTNREVTTSLAEKLSHDWGCSFIEVNKISNLILDVFDLVTFAFFNRLQLKIM